MHGPFTRPTHAHTRARTHTSHTASPLSGGWRDDGVYGSPCPLMWDVGPPLQAGETPRGGLPQLPRPRATSGAPCVGASNLPCWVAATLAVLVVVIAGDKAGRGRRWPGSLLFITGWAWGVVVGRGPAGGSHTCSGPGRGSLWLQALASFPGGSFPARVPGARPGALALAPVRGPRFLEGEEGPPLQQTLHAPSPVHSPPAWPAHLHLPGL